MNLHTRQSAVRRTPRHNRFLNNRFEQRLLAIEIEIERALGNTGTRRRVVKSRRGKAFFDNAKRSSAAAVSSPGRASLRRRRVGAGSVSALLAHGKSGISEGRFIGDLLLTDRSVMYASPWRCVNSRLVFETAPLGLQANEYGHLQRQCSEAISTGIPGQPHIQLLAKSANRGADSDSPQSSATDPDRPPAQSRQPAWSDSRSCRPRGIFPDRRSKAFAVMAMIGVFNPPSRRRRVAS